MMLFRCPEGHRYGLAGYGEDLTQKIERPGTRGDCPECTMRRLRADVAKASRYFKTPCAS